jgi:Phage integrase, N-terminal SAM-like domain
VARYLKQNVCERTYEDYVGLLKLYVRPTLGTKKLSNLRPLDVQEFVNGMVLRYKSMMRR